MRTESPRTESRGFPIAFCLALFGASLSAQAGAGDGSPGDPNLRFLGRWDRSDPAAYRSHWSGAYLRARFTGTRVKIKLGARADMMVRIDGKPFVAYKGASGTVDLTSVALSQGTHSLVAAARWQADELLFQGLVLDAGGTTLPDSAGRGIVEFIGDSITCGEKTGNAEVTAFPWLAGELLGRDHTHICFGGITLVDGYHYNYDGAPMVGQEVQYFKQKPPKRYNMAHDGRDPDWDFSAYSPKAIVINLGTNDNSLRVPSATFKAAYARFLRNIRAKEPDAILFAMRTFGGFFEKETQEAVADVIASGEKRLHFINTAGWIPSSDFADNLHPDDSGHSRAAARLRDALAPHLEASAAMRPAARPAAGRAAGALPGAAGKMFRRAGKGGTVDARGRSVPVPPASGASSP